MSVEWSFPRNSGWLLLEDIYFSVSFWSQLVGFLLPEGSKSPCLTCLRIVSRPCSQLAHICQVFSPDPAELNLFMRCNIQLVLFVCVQPLVLQGGCCWPCGGSGRLYSQVVPEGTRRERRCREAPWSLASVVAGWKSPVSMTSNSQVLCFTSGRQCCSWWQFDFN